MEEVMDNCYKYRHKKIRPIAATRKYPLPKLNKLLLIYQRDKLGNEKIEKVKGVFVSCSNDKLMKLIVTGKNYSYSMCYSKSDIILGIYRYEYINEAS
ncbi:hypothetical protein [Alkaliphilus transvaalensis]|uniref:hypothetical protein n=1 Tax=Alkaliphilus transvaalensis TaxID=114628 RepID=UPI00047CB980|nr:hypothetical protein [Alkaliphilus transvaalensis]